MNKAALLTLILGILILTSSIAHAAQKDIIIYSPTRELSACGCQIIQDSVTIYNTGAVDSWYKLESSNEWVSFEENVVYIERSSSKEIKVTISVPCGAKSSSYDFMVTSLTGSQNTITKEISVEQCNNLKTALVLSDELTESNSTINPCESAEYLLYIQNTGPFEEEYNFRLSNDFGVNGSFVLPSLQTKKIPVIYTPSCELYGNIPINIDIWTTGSDLKASITSSLQILQNYDFALSFPDYTDDRTYKCRDAEGTIPFKLTNLADVSNNYSLSLTGPDFVSLDTREVKLDGLNSYEGSIKLNAVDKTGDYELILRAQSAIGDASAQDNVTLYLQTCYDAELNLDAKEDYSCENSRYTLSITNNADVDQDVTFEIDGEEIYELSADEISLNPGETKTITVDIVNPKNDNVYTLVFKGVANGQELSRGELVYHALSDYSCTQVNAPNPYLRINYDTQYKSIRVENWGIWWEFYDVQIEGPDWIGISQDSLELDAKQSVWFELFFTEHSDIPTGDYVAKVTFYSANTDQTYNIDVTIQLRDKTILEKGYAKLYGFFMFNLATNVMFLLLCILLFILILCIVVKVTAPKYPYRVANKIKQKKHLLGWLIVLFIATVILVYVAFGFPYLPQPSQYVSDIHEDGVITWAEDTTLVFNLTQYVSDPDMDLLEYQISELDYIDAQLSDGIVTFISPKDWFGEELVFFTATDEFGQSAMSEVVTLHVVDVPEFTYWDYVKPWFWTVNLLIWLAILIVFFSIFVVHNRRKKNGKKEKK